MPIVDYEKIKLVQLKKNVKNLKSGDVKKKIKEFSKRSGYSYDEIAKKIDGDEMFRWFFAKDPIKQNIHEYTAVNFIKKLDGVKDFKKLGTDEMFVINGGVLLGTELKSKQIRPKTKSVDFYWKYGNTEFFISHKYTKDGGGGQDNQYHDLISYIQECNNSTRKNTTFLVIADGKFYDSKNGKAGTSKIQHLKQIADKRTTFALTINDLEKFMKKLK